MNTAREAQSVAAVAAPAAGVPGGNNAEAAEAAAVTPSPTMNVTNFAAPQQQTFLQTESTQRFKPCARRGCKLNACECGGFVAAKCTNKKVETLSETQIEVVEREKAQQKKKRKSEVEQQRQKMRKKDKALAKLATS